MNAFETLAFLILFLLTFGLVRAEFRLNALDARFQNTLHEVPIHFSTFDTRTLAPTSAGVGPKIETPQSLDWESEQDQGQGLRVVWPEGACCDLTDPYGGVMNEK